MKKKHSLTMKLVPTLSLLLVLLAGAVFLWFFYEKEERAYHKLTKNLFLNEMTASTLNMHYTIANPSAFGITEYEVKLPYYDKTASMQALMETETLLAQLSEINSTNLENDDAYTHKLLTRSLENSLLQNSYSYYAEPLSPSSGMQSQLPILLAEYSFRTERDVQDYLELLDQTDTYFASLLTYEQEKAAAGLLMPASSLEKVKDQCDRILTKEALQAGTHFLQTTFPERLQSLIDTGVITAEQADFYCAENNRLLRTVMQPAYVALADGLFLLEDTSIPLSGLSAKPDGAAYYETLLCSETGSHRTVADVKELLTLAFDTEYQAIHSLLTKHPELNQYLSCRDATLFPYQTPEEMLADLQKRMQEDFPGFSEGTLPTVTVKTVSSSLADYCAPAFYLTAPLDDTDSNVIYINPKQTQEGLELYTTLAHEGYPGHLYQTVYSNRHMQSSSQDPLRQVLWYGGYLEGWALYVEFHSFDYASTLMTEQGNTREALAIQLEKHSRSLQLCLYSLLDIMIHYDNASYSQVTDVLEAFGITNAASVNAIYTYIVEEPCNYLKYYLGYLEILELQKQAKTLWGANYSDLRFHTFYLDCGPSDFLTLQEELINTPLPQSCEKTDSHFGVRLPKLLALPH